MYSWKKIWPLVVTSGFLAFLLAVQLPVEIYINNADEFTVSLTSLFAILSVALLSIFLLFFLPGIFPFPAFRERYVAFLAMLGLLMWVTSHFLFGHYGAFDQRGLQIDPFSLSAILEALLWVLLLIIAPLFAKQLGKILVQIIGLLWIVNVGLISYQVVQHIIAHEKPVRLSESETFIPEEFLRFSSRGNIIHIVLDEQQSSVTENLFAWDPRYAKQLEGFIFFPNTSANYRSTVMAIPAMLTGKLYKNEMDKNLFLEQELNQNPLLKTLEKAGYKTDIYTMNFYCQKIPKNKNCYVMPGLSANNSAYLLLDYSLFKAAPDILKPEIYREDEWVIRRRFVNPNYHATYGGLNHLSFQYFNQHLKVEDIPPTYKFYHSMITHSPAVLDAECQLRLARISRHDLIGKREQAACAFQHILNFLHKLKTENIYDNTFIIISSDHGANYLPPQTEQAVKNSTIDERHYTTSLATLLIKPFNAHGPLQISYAPIALNDIPNTILAATQLPLLKTGENALTIPESSTRTREFIFYEMDDTYWNTEKLPPLNIYAITGDVRDINSWKLVCADQNELVTTCSPK